MATKELETKDTRPLHVCYMCCARLHNCLRLRTACLHSEELFSHLLANDSWEVTPSQDMNKLQTTPVLNISVGPVVHSKLNIHPSPVKDEKLNEDWVEDLEDNVIEQGTCTQFIKEESMNSKNVSSEDEELDYSIQSTKAQASDNSCVGDDSQDSDISKSNHNISSVDNLKDDIIIEDEGLFCQIKTQEDMNPENASSEDEELDYSIQSTKAQASDNSCVRDDSQNSDISNSNHSISSADLQDICAKTVKIVLHRMDLNTATVTEHLNPTDLEYTSQCNTLNYSENVEMLKPNICEEYKQIVHTSSETHCSENSRTHTIYKCRICEKIFTKQSVLNVHFRNTHRKRYACNKCKRSFTYKSKLLVHIRSHTGEKPFRCLTCDKGFNESGNLTKHIRSHTGEKPFRCPTCDKGFNYSGHLTIHIRSHTGEKPFRCPTCDKGFYDSSHLTRHIRTHTGEKPFRCSTCDKGFNKTFDLSRHIRTHTGEKPFRCPTCDKGFNQSSILIRHIRSHTGEKPYKCDTCGKGFIMKTKLSNHILVHTRRTLQV